jgi:hypothetical protein
MELLFILAIIVGILNGFHAMKMARIDPERYGCKPQKRYWYFRNHGMGMGFRTGDDD